MKYKAMFAFLAMTGALSGCVAQSGDVASLQNRISQLEQQNQQLAGQLSGVQPAQADTWSQVQTLRQEMAALKGQIDNLNHATAPIGGVAGLADRVARHDRALRTLENQLTIPLNLDTPAAMQATSGMAVPGTAAGMPGAGQPLVQPEPQQPVQPVQAEPQTAQQADVAKVLYDNGLAAFNAGKFSEALNAFADFTNTYPKHSLIGNAWFWKGESNYKLKNYPDAALDYEKVITSYPKNVKVPSAYLKQAMSFKEVGKKDVARFRLEDLIKKFPNTPEAARAKNVLKEL